MTISGSKLVLEGTHPVSEAKIPVIKKACCSCSNSGGVQVIQLEEGDDCFVDCGFKINPVQQKDTLE